MLKLYSDGGARGNPGVAGFGFVILDDEKILRTGGGGFLFATNNQMEIMGCIEGIRCLKEGSKVEVYSDSQYVVKTMKGEFKKKANLDLWEALDKEVAKVEVISWNWVKGHADNEFNIMCDKIANEQMQKISDSLKEVS